MVNIFNHQYGNCTNQSEDMWGVMRMGPFPWAPLSVIPALSFGFFQKAHFMSATPGMHHCVLCFQNNVHVAAHWTAVNQDRDTNVGKWLRCSVKFYSHKMVHGAKIPFSWSNGLVEMLPLGDSQWTFIYSQLWEILHEWNLFPFDLKAFPVCVFFFNHGVFLFSSYPQGIPVFGTKLALCPWIYKYISK